MLNSLNLTSDFIDIDYLVSSIIIIIIIIIIINNQVKSRSQEHTY
jgi:hypothetical protein